MDLDAGRRLDVCRGDGACALLAQVHDDRLVVLAGDHQLLDVQDEFGDILLHALKGRELMEDPLHAKAGDSRSGNGRQERPTKRVAQGVPESGLEGLEDEPRAELADRLLGEHGALANEHSYFLPATTTI